MPKRVVLIIQARMGSQRLPGKSMMDLAGAPLVGRILERVKRCKRVEAIVLAIPDTQENRALADLGRAHDVEVYAGSEHDVLERYYQAACFYQADFVVRLPADNVVPEPGEIDRIITHHLSLGCRGFSSNLAEIQGSGYPDGIGAEIFDFSLLAEARDKAFTAEQREHVHLNFFDYSTQEAVDDAWCPIHTLVCPKAFRRPDLVLDVNTEVQYERMRSLYEALYFENPTFHITDVIRWHDAMLVGD